VILLFGEQRFEFIAVAQRETNLQMQQLVAVGCAELALAFHCRRMISGQSPVVICVTDIGNENHAGDRCQAERAERVDAADRRCGCCLGHFFRVRKSSRLADLARDCEFTPRSSLPLLAEGHCSGS
jgi:hypothetical protein